MIAGNRRIYRVPFCAVHFASRHLEYKLSADSFRQLTCPRRTPSRELHMPTDPSFSATTQTRPGVTCCEISMPCALSWSTATDRRHDTLRTAHSNTQTPRLDYEALPWSMRGRSSGSTITIIASDQTLPNASCTGMLSRSRRSLCGTSKRKFMTFYPYASYSNIPARAASALPDPVKEISTLGRSFAHSTMAP